MNASAWVPISMLASLIVVLGYPYRQRLLRIRRQHRLVTKITLAAFETTDRHPPAVGSTAGEVARPDPASPAVTIVGTSVTLPTDVPTALSTKSEA